MKFIRWVLFMFMLVVATSSIAALPDPGETVLVKKVDITGFLLHDKAAIKSIERKWRNIHLSRDDINQIVDEVMSLYIQEGYEKLVYITPQYKRRVLTLFVGLAKK